jgi:hypothetical protein
MRRGLIAAVVGVVGLAACSGGAGGSGGGQDPCAPTYPGTLVTSTIHGSGFDQWEGWGVWACLDPAQSFGSGCGSTSVAAGQFSQTESTCTGVLWRVTINRGNSSIACTVTAAPGGTNEITPAACACDSNCDAGTAADAATDH